MCYIVIVMLIRYLGHSSFKVRGSEGAVITDPYENKVVGLELPRMSAEVVTVSHDHEDHNAAERVQGTSNRKEPFVITKPGEYEASEISVIGVSSKHDDEDGSKRGDNIIFTFKLDGIWVAHLGDLGHKLSSRQINKIGAIDVLMLPVGGEYTIGPKMAMEVVKSLSPSIVIPMHYKVKGMNKQFDKLVTVDEFLEKASLNGVDRLDKLSIGSRNQLPEETEVIVMEM